MRKVLMIGEDKSNLMLQSMREQYGEDAVFYTIEEAEKEGLTMSDFSNLPTMKITAPPIFEHEVLRGVEKSGQQNRRERRKNKRK